MSNSKILVIGSLNMDMVIQVDNMPKVGETILGNDIKYVPGGKGANQAYAVAKLNGNVTMLGKVGMDNFGDELINNLKTVGVDISFIEKEECSTGLASIYVNGAGNNSIVVIPGANATCNKDYIMKHVDQIKEAQVIILQMEIPLDAIEYSIKLAKENNKVVILNPAPAPDNIKDEILSLIDYITPNETELAKLTKMPTDTIEEVIAASKLLISKGVKNVITTCGSRGSVFVNITEHSHYSVKEVKAVDTTAAGDTFNGAFAVKLLECGDISESINFANNVAGIAVTREGAQSSIPSREEVDFKVLVTDSSNEDFIKLTHLLDQELHNIYGELQKQFDKFNKLTYIKDVVVIYKGDIPVGCGAFKKYNNNSIELKRIFVSEDNRGQKISKLIVNTLEDIAKNTGYTNFILETGTKQHKAVSLYKKLGYCITDKYSPYVGNENSICMSKSIQKLV